MATKAELQQALVTKTNELARANQDIAFLRAQLAEADVRTRRVIASVNHSRRTGNPERRAAMEAARAKAIEMGKRGERGSVKAEF